MSAAPPILDLEKMPREKATHHLADYVELLCLASADGEVSAEDFVDRRIERSDVGEGGGGDDDADEPSDHVASAKVDRYRLEAVDIFRHLRYRSKVFGSSYPFRVDAGGELVVRKKRLSRLQKQYVFFLLASSLRFVTPAHRPRIQQQFERLGTEVLRGWLPGHAEVHAYGTASENSRYSGTAWAKAKKLAADLREQLLVNKDDFAATDTGDTGLDTVAWLPMGDETPGLLAIFAQTTCRVDWEGKQNESGVRWSHHLPPRGSRANVLVIPFCFRKPDGAWYDAKKPYDCVLLDRLRLDWLCRSQAISCVSVPLDVVQAALAFREEPV